MSPSTINKRQKLLGAIVCEKCHSMLHLCPRRAVSTPSLIITIQFRQTFLLGSAGIWGSSSFMKKPNNNMRSKHCHGWQKRRRGKGVELETKVIRRFAKISQSRRRPLQLFKNCLLAPPVPYDNYISIQFHIYLPWSQCPCPIVHLA